MLHVLTNEYTTEKFSMFMDVIQTHFLENFEKNKERINALCKIFPKKKKLQTSIYKLEVLIDYHSLLERFQMMKDTISAK